MVMCGGAIAEELMIKVGRVAGGCAALVLLAASPGSGRADAEAQDLVLAYDVSVYGVHAMRWEVTLTRDAQSYASEFRARASGLASLLSDLEINARTGGRQRDGRLQPRSYTSRYKDEGETRTVLIAYGADGPIMTRARPPASEEDRETVPKDALAGALDPLAGAYALLREVAKSGICEGEVPIFDGRRLFQLSLQSAAEADAEDAADSASGAAAAAKAMRCRAELDKVAGFKPKERRDKRFPDEIMIELAPAGPDGTVLPVRLTMEHRAGPISITLADVRVQAEAADATRVDASAQ